MACANFLNPKWQVLKLFKINFLFNHVTIPDYVGLFHDLLSANVALKKYKQPNWSFCIVQ